jgi:hypothetical protein
MSSSELVATMVAWLFHLRCERRGEEKGGAVDVARLFRLGCERRGEEKGGNGEVVAALFTSN